MGRKKLGEGLNLVAIVDEYLRNCMSSGALPTVADLAEELRLSRGTLSRRYAEATGLALAGVLRGYHARHLRDLARRNHCLERVAELSGYSCARSVRRRLRAISTEGD